MDDGLRRRHFLVSLRRKFTTRWNIELVSLPHDTHAVQSSQVRLRCPVRLVSKRSILLVLLHPRRIVVCGLLD